MKSDSPWLKSVELAFFVDIILNIESFFVLSKNKSRLIYIIHPDFVTMRAQSGLDGRR
jgi:hypothetical protein